MIKHRDYKATKLNQPKHTKRATLKKISEKKFGKTNIRKRG